MLEPCHTSSMRRAAWTPRTAPSVSTSATPERPACASRSARAIARTCRAPTRSKPGNRCSTRGRRAQGQHDLSVFGPNGFLRAFRGSISSTTKANLRVESRYDVDDDTVELIIVNLGKNDCRITVDNAYGNDRPVTRRLRSNQSDRQHWNLKKTFGWYDLSIAVDTDPGFLRRLAGHLENGRDSVSDPALGLPQS
jgi:Domain of unknown function (DUF756)